MKHTIHTLCALLVAGLLSACGTTVSLDESQVSDAKGVPVQAEQAAGGSATGVKQVSTVDPAAAAKGPAQVAQVIYFDFDSDAVKPEFQPVVAAHAKHLIQNKSVKVFLEGHTDERGGREYNLALGQRRAEAVRRTMNLLGVADSQMEAVSFGKEKPADAGTSDDSMAKNRRAHFSYR
jgi:peptidoglycan-associated lipoprotein